MLDRIIRKKKNIYRFGNWEYDLGSRAFLMGILNVTPDSFSDGGKFFDVDLAVEHAMQMVRDGADFVDVGGESTRPGSEPVADGEEIRRVVPVIERLAKEISVPISIDTCKSSVAEAAIEAGAVMVNDISGLTYDSSMVDVVAQNNVPVVIMHIKGWPKNMQVNPQYENVVREIADFLVQQSTLASRKGIEQIIIDPGIGFGKNLQHNLDIIRGLREFADLGFPVLVGPSRKSFIGALLDLPATERIEGTAAAVAASILNGASIIRVHDVKEMKRVARVADALKSV